MYVCMYVDPNWVSFGWGNISGLGGEIVRFDSFRPAPREAFFGGRVGVPSPSPLLRRPNQNILKKKAPTYPRPHKEGS